MQVLGGQRDEQGSIALGWEQGVGDLWIWAGGEGAGGLHNLLLGTPKPTAQPLAPEANPQTGDVEYM